MHTIKLKVHDDIYSHIIFLLNSLDKKKIEIVEDKPLKNKNKDKKTLNAIKIDTSNFKFDRQEANER
ncbi:MULTISPECIES: hypothetical protein [Aliarcobacter]|uniref:hypothetical protein n=1 Tax=Aliarcobacter TaxID=2321111 RepID=UPI0021B48BFC|nr:hypothetical protein [Aliarcobacter skirrowii]MCT7446980.1 hypothetical protein [Aliarcobacter skirrowii]MDD2508590.1 hypothetical protein [Aliarcobacter skirrowii]MDD3025862.1 hypothetical protein [Aliarcobacter skirrowii]MDD3497205.1 hypothetical protein [Aliarcobacter skirrowii]MDX4025718.1 hypothetical protein [Aliarcobacter skirrowii]